MIRLIQYIILIVLPLQVVGQANIQFDRITTKDGLSQNTVRSILKDQYGFIWFGTHDGQNVYLWSNSSTNQNQQWKFTAVNTKSALIEEGEVLSLDGNNILVYPNPASGVINLDFVGDGFKQASVRVFNLLGGLVHAEGISGKENVMNISHLTKGVYVIRGSSENFSYNGKIMVE